MKKVTIIKTTISDSELTEAFSHLTMDDLKRITTEEKINRKRALQIAAVYGLYFGMLITEAKYGDIPGFEVINPKYKL